jgi:hypothetical protein
MMGDWPIKSIGGKISQSNPSPQKMKLHTIVVLFGVIFICIQLGSCATVVTTVTTTATLGTIFQANLKSLGNHTLFNGVSIITIQTNNSAKLKLFHNFLNATTFQLKYGPVPEANWSIPFDQSVSPLFFEGNITLNKTMMDYLTASSWHVYVSDVSGNVMLSGTFMNCKKRMIYFSVSCSSYLGTNVLEDMGDSRRSSCHVDTTDHR